MRWAFATGLLGLGLAAGVAGFVVRAPADKILGHLAQRAGSAVKLVGPQGSLWHGNAQALAVAGYRAQNPRWQTNPAALLGGTVHVAAQYGDGRHGGAGTLALDLLARTASLRDARARIPAAAVNRQLEAVLTVPLAGTFTLDLDRVAASRAGGGKLTAAQGTVTWKAAALKLGDPVALGTIRAELAPGKRGGLRARLSDRGDGPLAVAGTVRLRRSGAIRLDARLRARDSAEARLKQGLAALGEPAAEGGRRVRFSGRLALP